jgi:hypothetical protein
MGTFLDKRLRVSRQQSDFGTQAKEMVQKTKTLDQPTAEKARATRYKEPLAAQLIPQPLGISGD